MDYIEKLVEDAIIENISEADKKAIIRKELESSLRSRDLKGLINDAIQNRVKKEVIIYMRDNPKIFDKIPKIIDEMFKEEMKELSGIRGLIKRHISNATIRYYLERQLDRFI